MRATAHTPAVAVRSASRRGPSRATDAARSGAFTTSPPASHRAAHPQGRRRTPSPGSRAARRDGHPVAHAMSSRRLTRRRRGPAQRSTRPRRAGGHSPRSRRASAIHLDADAAGLRENGDRAVDVPLGERHHRPTAGAGERAHRRVVEPPARCRRRPPRRSALMPCSTIRREAAPERAEIVSRSPPARGRQREGRLGPRGRRSQAHRPRRTRGVQVGLGDGRPRTAPRRRGASTSPSGVASEALVVLGVSPELGFDRALVAALYVAGVRPSASRSVPHDPTPDRSTAPAVSIQPTERSSSPWSSAPRRVPLGRWRLVIRSCVNTFCITLARRILYHREVICVSAAPPRSQQRYQAPRRAPGPSRRPPRQRRRGEGAAEEPTATCSVIALGVAGTPRRRRIAAASSHADAIASGSASRA